MQIRHQKTSLFSTTVALRYISKSNINPFQHITDKTCLAIDQSPSGEYCVPNAAYCMMFLSIYLKVADWCDSVISPILIPIFSFRNPIKLDFLLKKKQACCFSVFIQRIAITRGSFSACKEDKPKKLLFHIILLVEFPKGQRILFKF